jgi:hypothetical protein
MGVRRALRFHCGNAVPLEVGELRPPGGSNCQRADIIQWIMLHKLDYLVGTLRSMRKGSWLWRLALGESSYGVISKAVPA